MASRSIAHTFPGMACPESMRFGYVHGPAAAVAHVALLGSILPKVGSIHTLQIGPSVFRGFVTNREFDPKNNLSSVRLVDWRDMLRDKHFFASYNMQEDDGRFYHILDQDWANQVKTYVTRALEQQDYFAVQAGSSVNTAIAKQRLFSCYELLNYLGQKYHFRISGELKAVEVLQRTFPSNLDWNTGVLVADAVQQLCDKASCQYTCIFNSLMLITLRGISDNTFVNSFLSTGNLCTVGADAGSFGEELNERGRRVKIIGERNRHEWVYLCVPNWNPIWTWSMAYGGIELSSLLIHLKLTLNSKLKDMPEEYRDGETWSEAPEVRKGAAPERWTRNEMTIKEYITKIVYKAYVVNSGITIKTFTTGKEDEFEGEAQHFDQEHMGVLLPIDEATGLPVAPDSPEATMPIDETPFVEWDDTEGNFFWPLAPNLIYDNNMQFLVYCTSRKIIRGKDHPFAEQMSFVPRVEGISISTEEVIDTVTAKSRYRIRVLFNQPQFWMNPELLEDDPNNPDLVEPDKVLVDLCCLTSLFQYEQGDNPNALRVREKKLSVGNLYQAFVDGVEANVLRDNFLKDMKEAGVPPPIAPVKAVDIAKHIATQALFHSAITKSGNLSFLDRCGFLPDGLVDSVSVEFDQGQGVRESVNFTSGPNDDKEIRNPTPLKQSAQFFVEDELARERLKAVVMALMKDREAMAKLMGIVDTGMHEPGALFGPISATAMDRDGIMSARLWTTAPPAKPLNPGTVLVYQKAKTN